MNRIVIGLFTILAVGTIATSATRALFIDTETSTGNTFAAGSMDLSVDGNNGLNTQKFDLSNVKPGDTFPAHFVLHNSGTIGGFLDLESISWSIPDNTWLEPEKEAGDINDDGMGELQNYINIHMWYDYDHNGVQDAGDPTIYNGLVKDLSTSYDLDYLLGALQTSWLHIDASWTPTATDAQAMTDGLILNLTFELLQNAD